MFISYSVFTFDKLDLVLNTSNTIMISGKVTDIIFIFECYVLDIHNVIRKLKTEMLCSGAKLAIPAVHMIAHVKQQEMIDNITDIKLLLTNKFLTCVNSLVMAFNKMYNSTNNIYIFDKSNKWETISANVSEITERTPILDSQSDMVRCVNFYGAELKVAAAIAAPYLISNTVHNTSVYSGLLPDLLNTLADEFNFTSKFVITNNFGVVNDEGQWTGMVADHAMKATHEIGA